MAAKTEGRFHSLHVDRGNAFDGVERRVVLNVNMGYANGRLVKVPLTVLELADLVDQAASVLRGELRRAAGR